MQRHIGSKIKDVSVLKRLLFATAFIPKEVPDYWEIVAKFGSCQSEGVSLSSDSARVTMETLEFLDSNAFCLDTDLMREIVHMEFGKSKQPLGVILLPEQDECLHCKSNLLLKRSKPSRITLYTINLGTVPATHYHKYCSKYRQGCKYVQYYGYGKSGVDGGAIYNENWMSLKYFISSQETGFETLMLKNYDAELLIGQLSYKQKADIYNLTNGYDNAKKMASTCQEKVIRLPPVHGAHEHRQPMDRRRFEAAHLKFAALQFATSYPDVLPLGSLAMHSDIGDTLTIITPLLYNAFRARYAAHSCTFPGCGTVLVLDGNMKNYRDLSNAKDAGYIEFEGLDGQIKTGCSASPDFKSRYCAQHKDQACDLLSSEQVKADEELDVPLGPTLRSSTRQVEPGELVAERILAKKATRRQTYYQVLWLGLSSDSATWEPACSLPSSMVEDYEAGISREAEMHTATTYGHSFTTLTVNKQKEDPRPKKRKLHDPSHPHLEGVFVEDQSQPKVLCRTEKDRGGERLNHRTAGILAGMWPCGVITWLNELFVSESKSQVYGQLHDYLRSAPSTALNIKYVCYDDGCHLKKYASNPKRSEKTSTAKLISKLHIVVDKMHMKGHIDSWCKKTCDSHLFSDLDKKLLREVSQVELQSRKRKMAPEIQTDLLPGRPKGTTIPKGRGRIKRKHW